MRDSGETPSTSPQIKQHQLINGILTSTLEIPRILFHLTGGKLLL